MPINFAEVTRGISSTEAAAAAAGPKKADSTGGLANQDTFLKLLIAQIRNQNPLEPTDGIQFISQLAQFSTLEQNLGIRSNLDSILATLNERLPKPPDTGTTDGNNKTTDETNKAQGAA